jgi:serine/threonine protein kinase
VIGYTISNYKIIEKLGQGSMGVVYLAVDVRLKRKVALKFLPQHLQADEESNKRFIHEAQAASALDNNHIYTIHEIGETDEGQLFIVMTHYEGETLRNRIARGPLPIAKALDIVCQVTEGIAKAHRQGIIHRDIKPANIMITTDGVAKILDFGLAKMKLQTHLTKPGVSLGTITYSSPEQTLGQQVDHRTDIWSIGVLLYEMLASEPPFKGKYEHEVLYSVLNEEPESIADKVDGLPVGLVEILDRTLAKDQANRYQYTTDLLRDIHRLKKDVEEKDSQLKKNEE